MFQGLPWWQAISASAGVAGHEGAAHNEVVSWWPGAIAILFLYVICLILSGDAVLARKTFSTGDPMVASSFGRLAIAIAVGTAGFALLSPAVAYVTYAASRSRSLASFAVFASIGLIGLLVAFIARRRYPWAAAILGAFAYFWAFEAGILLHTEIGPITVASSVLALTVLLPGLNLVAHAARVVALLICWTLLLLTMSQMGPFLAAEVATVLAGAVSLSALWVSSATQPRVALSRAVLQSSEKAS